MPSPTSSLTPFSQAATSTFTTACLRTTSSLRHSPSLWPTAFWKMSRKEKTQPQRVTAVFDNFAEQMFSQFPTEGPSIRALCLGSADFGKVWRSRPQNRRENAPGQSRLWILALLSIWILECPTLWILALRSTCASYFVTSLRRGLCTIAMDIHHLVLSLCHLSVFIFRSCILLDGFLESLGSGCSAPRRCPTRLEEEILAISRTPPTGGRRDPKKFADLFQNV